MGERLTWPEGLRVSESDKAAVVNFSLRGGTKKRCGQLRKS